MVWNIFGYGLTCFVLLCFVSFTFEGNSSIIVAKFCYYFYLFNSVLNGGLLIYKSYPDIEAKLNVELEIKLKFNIEAKFEGEIEKKTQG